MRARSFPLPEAYFAAARRLRRWLKACVLCPRRCKAPRLEGQKGFCRAAGDTAAVNIAQLHFGEEPPISGHKGSGTVFFAGCTLACCFCQNYEISQVGWGEELTPAKLAEVFLELQAEGAHNINLVTPTPHLVVILEALGLARSKGLAIPVVYNTSGYERPATIRAMSGLIEIYMPDFKYADDTVAERLSNAPGYYRYARAALREMCAQVGELTLDEQGVAVRGVLVRHLVLPEGLAGTREVMRTIAEVCGKGAWISLMSQYFPAYKARNYPEIARPITGREYREAIEAMHAAGLSNGFIQGLASATDEWVPRFRR